MAEGWNYFSNAIIFYNESIFMNLLESKVINLDEIKQMSPVAWQHINFFGRYEFTKTSEPIDLEVVTKPIKKSRSL